MGGGQFLDFVGDTAVMRGDTELMGGPPTKENPATWPRDFFNVILWGPDFVVS